MVRPITKTETAIERPVADAQSVFDELCAERKTLNGHIKLRHEGLEAVVEWKDLTKKLATSRLARKNVEVNFDEENPSHKSRISGRKDQIDAIEAKLTGLALEHFKKTGAMLEVSKKTRRDTKKVRIGFAFRQMSLF